MGMFANLGPTLSLLRELRGKSQVQLAKEAGIGKSQLSKYEKGKEFPKLDSLEKVLKALKIGYFEFFYTLSQVDRRAAELKRTHEGALGSGSESRLYLPPLIPGESLLAEATDQAFRQVFTDLLLLYRRTFEQVVQAAVAERKDLEPAS